jgi:cytochrome c biogenesis protein CcmG/thiol:disulfide interchange protein DsbE
MRACALAIAAMGAALLAGCGSDEDAPATPPRPAPGLESDAGKLVGGGPKAFSRQLAALRGTPVVVNQWASWCGPCRFEFPFFARTARKYSGRVAFLGVDSRDGREAANEFLRENPIPYPSFFDPDSEISREYRGTAAMPTTVFYDRSGRIVDRHFGAYATQAKLEEDIRRHLLRGG